MAWHMYFITKLTLYHSGQLSLQAWANLALALTVYLPLPAAPSARWLRWLKIARPTATWLTAGLLLHAEIQLPAWPRLFEQASLLAGFSPSYLSELALRLAFDSAAWMMVGAAIGLASLCWLASRWLRMETLVLVALAVAPVWHDWRQQAFVPPSDVDDSTGSNTFDSNPAQALEEFWQRENSRRIQLTAEVPPQFDIAIVHVCSLSWDDIAAVGHMGPELLKRFDVVFDRFNSATSHSGPAMLRVARASCGQAAHDELYRPAPAYCGIYQQLRESGFSVEAVLNHDGRYDQFASSVAAEIGVPVQTPANFEGVPVAMRAFDNSLLADDRGLLSAWRLRSTATGEPRALYYNTISLHDGNRLIDAPGLDSLTSYRWRLEKLFDDVDQFITEAEKSGRSLILILLPEHGAAIRGNQSHIAGMREVPWPAVTHVPVAVKLIGVQLPPNEELAPLHVHAPSSYLSLSVLVARLLEGGALSPMALRQAVAGLPTTELVSDRGDVVVAAGMRWIWLRTPGGAWQRRAITAEFINPKEK